MFSSCGNMETAYLPNVTTIGAYAFLHCFSLVDVNITKVEYICEGAFNYAYNLRTLELPSIINVGGPFLVECSRLINISLPNAIRVPDYMFANLSNTLHIYIPKVVSIGKHSFEQYFFGENTFEQLKIKEIDDYAFSGCVCSDDLTFDYCEYVGNFAFCNTLVFGISLPNLKSCGNYSFCSFGYIEELYFPNLESCGDYSFSYNFNLINVTFPSLITIGDSPFEECPNLEIMNLPNLVQVNDYFISNVNMNHFEFLKLKYIGSNSFTKACDKVENINFPEVISIGDYFLKDCQRIRSISLPNVENIGKYAFYNCSNLIEVSLPKLKYFDSELFYYCNLIENISFPALETIGNNFLILCYNIKIINLPKVRNIINTAFYNCSSIYELNLNNITNVNEGPIAKYCKSLKIIHMNSLESSPRFLFAHMQSLEEVSLRKLKITKSYLFYNCTNLRNINMPNFETMIESDSGYEFAYCSSLETIKLPSIEEFYGRNTFQNCTSLVVINISKTTKLVEYMFSGCFDLIDVNLYSVTTLPSYCFKDCTSLKSIELNINELDGDGHFSGCINLEIINLPNLLEVSENATKIFENCKRLTIIYLPSSPPKTFNENIFSTTTKENLSICLYYDIYYGNYTSGSNGTGYWKGINITLNDDLTRKCNVHRYHETNWTWIDTLLICIGVVVLLFIGSYVLFIYLCRKYKKEKESLETVPHLNISIIDPI